MKKNIYLIIPAVILIFFFFVKRLPLNPQPIPKLPATSKKLVTLPKNLESEDSSGSQPNTNAAPPFSKANGSIPVGALKGIQDLENNKGRQGLCGLVANAQSATITIEDFLAIKKSEAHLVAIPEMNAKCLWKGREYTYQIVDYNFSNDFIFDFLGTVTLQLEDIGRYKSIADFIEEKKYSFSQLGKGDPKKVIQELAKQGIGTQIPFRLYSVSKIDSIKPRSPSGEYSFFPDTEFITPLKYEEIRNSSSRDQFKSTFFSLAESNRPNTSKNIGQEIPFMAELNTSKIISPDTLVGLKARLNEKLKNIELQKISTISANENQIIYSLNVINLLRLIQPNSYRLLKIDEKGKAIDRFTKNESVDLTYEQLTNINYSFVLDTRFKMSSNDYIISNSFRVPFKSGVSDLSSGYTFDSLKSAEKKNQPLVIIGQDTMDPGPRQLRDYLAKLGFPIRVYSAGFIDLEIRKRLGIQEVKFSKKFIKRKRVKFKKTTKEFFKKTGIKKIVTSKSEKLKSLKIPNRRDYLPKNWKKTIYTEKKKPTKDPKPGAKF